MYYCITKVPMPWNRVKKNYFTNRLKFRCMDSVIPPCLIIPPFVFLLNILKIHS